MTAIVLLSGGADSAVALYEAIADHTTVVALTVNYGQRSRTQEIKCAGAQCLTTNVPHYVFSVDGVANNCALARDGAPLPTTPATSPDDTFVPMRNTLLVSSAAALAESLGGGDVILGATADDNAGYPDCRPEWVRAMNRVLMLGTKLANVQLVTPFADMTKAQVVDRGRLLGVDFTQTWSCYAGTPTPCGECGACINRAAAGII